MSTFAITAVIILVLAIIVGNILLLKKSAKFDIRIKDPQASNDKPSKKNNPP